jgi:hypothetical protein
MRGFWADERIEGGIWKKSNPIGAYLIFLLQKRKKKKCWFSSDAIISLTHRAKSIILNWNLGINADKNHSYSMLRRLRIIFLDEEC